MTKAGDTLATVPEHRERYDRARTRHLGVLAFFFGFADAFLVYVLSSYFEEASGSSNVSVFYFCTFAITLFLLFFLHSLVRRWGSSSLLLLLLFFAIVAQVPLVFLPVSLWGALLIIVYFIVTTLAWVNIDIVLEHFSEDKRSGRIRGLYLAAVNLGILLAPLFSTIILGQLGFRGVFSASLLFYITLFFLALFSLYGVNYRFESKVSPLEILRKAFRRADILRIYAISFAIEFFYATMIVYTPIRLRGLGFSWEDIGIILTVMLIPFVIVQYPLGALADKRTGEKELLIGSLVLASLSTAGIAWIGSASAALWAMALFATRLGIASIEVLRDSYFYKRIDGGDGDLIAFFRTSRPLGNIVAAISIGIWLLFFPLPSVFLLPAAVLLLVLIPAFFLEDNASERERREDFLTRSQ